MRRRDGWWCPECRWRGDHHPACPNHPGDLEELLDELPPQAPDSPDGRGEDNDDRSLPW